MAVDDHGIEVLKKSGEEMVPGNKGDYYLKVGIASISAGLDPIPVVISGSSGSQPAVPSTGAAALTSISASVTSVVIVSANSLRIGLKLFNNSSSISYVSFGATSSSSAFTIRMGQFSYYDMETPVYNDVVSAIWVSATGSIVATELSIMGSPLGVAVLTSVTSSASSVVLLAANSSRSAVKLFNNSTSIAYIAYAATASSATFTLRMGQFSYYNLEVPIYSGILSAIWVSANGSMEITEL